MIIVHLENLLFESSMKQILTLIVFKANRIRGNYLNAT